MPELSIHSKPFPEPEPDPQRPGEYILASALHLTADQLTEMVRLDQLSFIIDLPFLELPLKLEPRTQTVLLGLGKKPDELVITLSTTLEDLINGMGIAGNSHLAFGLGAAWANLSREPNQQGE